MAKKFKGTTHLVFILDKSGSMSSVRSQIISGFNEYLTNIKDTTPENVKATLTTFDTKFNTVYANIDIEKAKALTPEEYVPGGLTALYDAVAYSVKAVAEDVKKKDRVLVVILTDGAENSSKEYTRDDIFKLISDKENEGNWTFTYIGSNQDSWLNAGAININAGNTANYDANQPIQAFAAMCIATADYMTSESKQSRSFYESTSKPE